MYVLLSYYHVFHSVATYIFHSVWLTCIFLFCADLCMFCTHRWFEKIVILWSYFIKVYFNNRNNSHAQSCLFQKMFSYLFNQQHNQQHVCIIILSFANLLFNLYYWWKTKTHWTFLMYFIFEILKTCTNHHPEFDQNTSIGVTTIVPHSNINSLWLTPTIHLWLSNRILALGTYCLAVARGWTTRWTRMDDLNNFWWLA